MTERDDEIRNLDRAIYEAEEKLARFNEMMAKPARLGADRRASSEFLRLMEERLSGLYAYRNALTRGPSGSNGFRAS
jgi:hypothetical protein